MQRFARPGAKSARLWRRQQSTDSKSLSKTLLLPQTKFPLWPKRDTSEVGLRHQICDGLYEAQVKNRKFTREPFVLHDGPPYANGGLHMGHAMNKIIKDVINRYNVMLGKSVHYVPGWDCHGLPIENKALKDLGAEASSLSPTALRAAARETALRELEVQKSEFKEFGIMADWSDSNTYRTLDHDYEIRQLNIFKTMVENGMIYRNYRPVHYSPSSRSALAEAELVYKDDHVSHSVYVTFDLDVESLPALREFGHSMKLLVWTTTPWTLTANMGVAVHNDLIYTIVKPETSPSSLIVAKELLSSLEEMLEPYTILGDIQGSELVGASYKPMFTQSGASFKVIHAPHVTSESGTGLVHCAPAHGAEDYNAFRDLEPNSMICHVNSKGEFSQDVATVVGEEAGKTLVGQPVLEGGSRAVVELVKAKGALMKIKRIKHKYPYDWRTDKPIIVTQWFANLDHIKDDAWNKLKQVQFFPEISRNRLESFIRGRTEWCISRQRVWGVPIPALHHKSTDRSILDAQSLSHIIGVLQDKGVDHWWTGPVEDFLPPSLAGEKEDWVKGTDTMDVWFDSGSSWSLLAPREPSRADVCVEGSDQHRGWFQSQLLTSAGVGEKSAPYGCLITHGMVLDEKGKKMSKSLGNVMSPITVVTGGKDLKKEPAYGADVLRLWVASVEYWRDASIGPKILAQAGESLRKVRNSARFMLGSVGELPGPTPETAKREMEDLERRFEDMDMADKNILLHASRLERRAFEDYQAFNFPKVVKDLVHFANIELSSLYLDINKDSLYANPADDPRRQATVAVMKQLLKTTMRVAAPILPHLAQEIYQTMYPNASGSVFLDLPWRPLDAAFEQRLEEATSQMAPLLRLRSDVLGLLEKARGDKRLKSSLEAEVDVLLLSENIPQQLLEVLNTNQDLLTKLFIVSDVVVGDEGMLGTQSPSWVYSGSSDIEGSEEALGLRVRPSTREKCPRCWTYQKEDKHDVCGRCEEVLGSGRHH
ncbi:isoleucyl-tRNA synthetase [Cylindrobasidium torrendii FP15055 ss-10]|uniref:isoleucine--tRNA ligase n=1 Tax=Cylindrobasidium torrendii FP15055 ss-10 TaxID=1314674 RepID=A0A0D7AWQ7_9AGAR|nr:isoleucyl-tRNA synthetase [Cylindrobasidium torrendii FP15055 ss-10]